MTASRLLFSLVLALGQLVATGVRADDFAVIASYLTDDVDDVCVIDLTKIDFPAALEEAVKLNLPPSEDIEPARQKAQAVQQVFAQLPAHGARRAFVLFRTSDIVAGGTTWVIEVGEGGDPAAIVKLIKPWIAAAANPADFGPLGMALPKELEIVGNVILGGPSAERLKTVKSAHAKPRPEALAALAALDGADAGVVAFGSQDSRRVVREMFPALPPPVADIDGRLLADHVQWIALTAKLPPEPKLALAIKAADAPTAAQLDQAVHRSLAFAKAFFFTELVSQAPEHRARAQTMGLLLPMLDPKVDGTRLTIALGEDPGQLAALQQAIAPAIKGASDAARRSRKMNSFKQILLAMHNYVDVHGALPSAASRDANGKPLLSWRVAILPFIDQKPLYEQFHLDEPWDSEHNRQLIEKMPEAYADSGSAPGRTTYLVPVGEGTIFPGPQGTKLSEVTDGLSNTMMLVDVVPERAVVWTKPEDWEVDLKNPLRGVKRSEGFTAGYADGSVRFLPGDIDPAKLAKIVTRAGGEVVEP